MFKKLSEVIVVELPIDLDIFAIHSKYIERIDESIPEVPEIIGIIVKYDNKYRLIDGYHRFKWALNNKEKGSFILVQ